MKILLTIALFGAMSTLAGVRDNGPGVPVPAPPHETASTSTRSIDWRGQSPTYAIGPSRSDYTEAEYGEAADLLNHATRMQNEGGGATGLVHGTVHAFDGEALVQGKGYPRGAEGFYIGNGQVMVIPPSPTLEIKMLEKGRPTDPTDLYVPKFFRRNGFSKYVSSNVRPNHPLNIFEEANAYSWELAAASHRALRRIALEKDGMEKSLEFTIIQLGMLRAMKDKMPEYYESTPALKALTQINIERTMRAWNASHDLTFPKKDFIPETWNHWYSNSSQPVPPSGIPKFNPTDYVTHLRNDADSAKLREFTRETFGEEWTKRVLGF